MFEIFIKDLISFILFFMAGAVNGSFAIFSKHTKRWRFENTWSQYLIWAFLLLPWIFAVILVPEIFSVYKQASSNLLFTMLIGGFFFGIGMACFAVSMNLIGIGLGFVINIGLSISLGFLLPLIIQHPEDVFTTEGIAILFSAILAVLGIILSNYAGYKHRKKRDEEQKTKSTAAYMLGVGLAIVAGLSSAAQNLTFSLTLDMQKIALKMGANQVGASIILWPGFLLCGFIPYGIFMLVLNIKNKSFKNYGLKNCGKYYLFTFLMGLFWFSSLIFYSTGSYIIGDLGPIIGWPIFMVIIILSSRFWSWKSGEWLGCNKRIRSMLLLGLLLLISSIMVLTLTHFLAEPI